MNAVTPLAVDDNRVLVMRANGTIVLLRKDGRLLHVFPGIGRGTDAHQFPGIAAALDGGQIVLNKPREIQVYAAASGRLLKHWAKVPSPAFFDSYVEDVAIGFVVYVTSDATGNAAAVHLLRLQDGREIVQPIRRSRSSVDEPLAFSLASARLTESGLFYTNESEREIAFVPMRSINSAFTRTVSTDEARPTTPP